MLSLAEIRAILAVMEPLVVGSRVQRMIQPDDYSLILELYGWDESAESGAKRWLVLSAHPQFGRASMRSAAPAAPSWPPDFAAWVKARGHRAFVRGLRIVNDDRQVALLIEGKDAGFELLLTLMGTRSNLYALDMQGKIAAAMRPLEKTRPDLHVGDAWTNPPRSDAVEAVTSRWPELSGEALLSAVQSHYEALESRHEYRSLSDSVERAIEKELEFARRRAAKLRDDLDAAKDAREKKRYGELLKQVMSNVDPGATSVVARDYETGEDVTIELDPRLSPSENLDRYFKRYHKGLVGTNVLGQQLEITQTHITETERLRADLAAITEMPALEEFAAKPVVRELLKKHFPDLFRPSRPLKKVPTRKDVPSRLLPRRYRTSDGLEVWVGKSDEGNDYLTTRLAAGNDLFFHVEGYPGSHTILRTGGRKDPPQESVLEAAELCAQFSKMKDAKKVDVHVVPIKHVHKPKGAKPGLVYVSNGKSVGLRRDPARLKRILEARIEE